MEGTSKLTSLDFGTLFKIVFWAGVCVWFAIAVLAALTAFVLPSAINVNGTKSTSTAQALVAAPILLIMGTIMSALFAAIGAGLLRLFGRYLPLGQVKTTE